MKEKVINRTIWYSIIFWVIFLLYYIVSSLLYILITLWNI